MIGLSSCHHYAVAGCSEAKSTPLSRTPRQHLGREIEELEIFSSTIHGDCIGRKLEEGLDLSGLCPPDNSFRLLRCLVHHGSQLLHIRGER